MNDANIETVLIVQQKGDRQNMRRKKFTAILLGLCLIISSLSNTVLAADFTEKDVVYELNDKPEEEPGQAGELKSTEEPEQAEQPAPAVFASAAANEEVAYLKEDKSEGQCTNYTLADENMTQWGTTGEETWYVADGNVTISGRINISGDVHLILKDNCELKAGGGINVSSSHSITIYAQSEGSDMGRLAASGGACQAAIGSARSEAAGNVTIHGGAVTASAPASEGEPAAIGGGGYGDAGSIRITGGVVYAAGCGKGIGNGARKESGEIQISGGVVYANGIGTGGYGESVTTYITGNSVVVSSNKINETEKTDWEGFVCTGAKISDSGGDITAFDAIGQVYGDVTLDKAMPLPDILQLDIPSGMSLTIPQGLAVILQNNASVTVEGTLTNNGKIYMGYGSSLNILDSLSGEVYYEVFIDTSLKVDITGESMESCAGKIYVKPNNSVSIKEVISGSMESPVVRKKDGAEVTFSENSFRMPDEPVQFSCTCLHPYNTDDVCDACGNYKPADLIDGVYQINSLHQFYWFAALVNGNFEHTELKEQDVSANAILTADIGTTENPVTQRIGLNGSYKGTFDGGNHTITLNLNEPDKYIALFYKIDGATIQNLHTAGTITTSRTYSGGIVCATYGSVTMRKCMSSVTINSSVDGDGTHGGLIGVGYGTVTMENCAFTGRIQGSSTHSCGGLIGFAEEAATFTNCMVAAEFAISNQNCENFARGWTTREIKNCYYLNPLAGSQGTQKSREAFASGEVAWLLNGGTSEGMPAWHQNLDNEEQADDVPVLSPSHGTVYYGYKGCILAYMNNSGSLEKGAHSFAEDGFCTQCGSYEPAKWNETEEYYEIGNAGQLYWFAALVNGNSEHADFEEKNASADAVLTADLNLSGCGNYEPIGMVGGLYQNASSESDIADWGYQGTFDGQGHVITKLEVPSMPGKAAGVFGTVRGTVQNLGVDNFYYYTWNGDARAGALTGQLLPGGVVKNCYVTNSQLYCSSGVVGSLVGGNFGGSIESCFAYKNFTQGARWGYFVGDNKNDKEAPLFYGTIRNCYVDSNDAPVGLMAVVNDVTYKSSADFSSGKVAYLLNGGSSEGTSVWRQNLDNGETEDAYPVLNRAHGIVYAGYKVCAPIYSNKLIAEEVGIPHDFGSDGICSVCGLYQPAVRGGETQAYQIGNIGQLYWFTALVNGDSAHAEFETRDLEANAILTADIGTTENPVSQRIGLNDSYKGTFDGGSHTITLDLVEPDSRAALFCKIDGATIQNLHTTGRIAASRQFSGGIAGEAFGNSTLKCCVSSVTIDSSVNGDGTHGGLIGVSRGNASLENCAFIGRIQGSKTTDCGGMIGWTEERVVLRNCMVAAEFGINADPDDSKTFSRGWNELITLENCYYLNPLGALQGTQKTAEAFASGEVTRLLQNGQGTLVWGQKLSGPDKDLFPVLASDLSQKVLQVDIRLVTEGAATDPLTIGYVNYGESFHDYPVYDGEEFARSYTFYEDEACQKQLNTATYTYTEDKTIYAAVTVNAPEYIVTIPASVELGQTATVSADKVTMTEEKKLVVTLSGTSGKDNAFTLSNGKTAVLAYTVTADKGSGAVPVTAGDTILEVAGGVKDNSGSTGMAFYAPAQTPVYSGEYTGKVTFTVTVENND